MVNKWTSELSMRSKFEIRAQRELEKEGWMCDWKIRPSGFKNPRGYQVDYFGLFDLLAYNPPVIRMIAIKGQSGVPSQLRTAIENFGVCDHLVKEIWTYRKLAGSRNKFSTRKEII
jgi:hypothetical protein